MDLKKVDRITLKSILKEILTEDVTLFKEVIREVLAENQIIPADKEEERRQGLIEMISDDFDKYEDTFKALA